MADSNEGAGNKTDEQTDDNEVLVLTFPLPREVESEPPDVDPDEMPTLVPQESLVPEGTGVGRDDTPTEPPDERPTEPPPAGISSARQDTPTEPPEEPLTLVPPRP